MLNQIKRFFVQPSSLVLFRKGRKVTEHHLVDFFTSSDFEYLHNMHLYAIFSHAVYCEIIDGFALEEGVRVKIPAGWELMENLGGVVEQPGTTDIAGLRYQVWENRIENKVIIALRGTRPLKWQDWYANLNFVTRYVPKVRNHYGQVASLIPGLVDEILDRMEPGVEIIATGHSLGGWSGTILRLSFVEN